MSSPQSFMVGNAPGGASYAAPLVNFGALQAIPEQYYKGRAAGAFAGGIPKDPATGAPDFNAILDQGARAGGVDFLKGILPYIYMSGANIQQTNQNTGDLYDPRDRPPPPKAANSTDQAGSPAAITGGQPATGQPPDPDAAPTFRTMAQEHYGAESEAAGAAIAAVKKAGVNVDRPLNSSEAARVKAYLNKAQAPGAARTAAPESGQPTAGPENTQEGQAVSSGPAREGGAASVPTPQEMATARQRIAQSPMPRIAGAPGPIATPGGGVLATAGPAPTGPTTEPGTARPQIARQPAPARQPPPQPAPQPAAEEEPPPRPPLDPLPDPAANDPTIRATERRISKLREDAAMERDKPKVLGRENRAADYEAQAKHLEEINAKRAEMLRKPFEKENAARAAGFPSARIQTQYEEADKKSADAGEKQRDAINGAAFDMGTDLVPQLARGKALVNAPGLVTGWGAETILDFNRAKQYFGDANAAVAQEVFQKTASAMQLAKANLQRFQAQMGGGNAARIFAHQINLISETSASLKNTVAGNRALVEIGSREAEAVLQIQKMATEHLKNNPYLDQRFNQKVADYLAKSPMFTSQEEKDPKLFMSAPEVPKEIMNDDNALLKWQHDMHLKPGEPVRIPGTRKYFHALTQKKQPGQ